MKSFLKDYSRQAYNTNGYDPVKMVNEDLDKHPDWRIVQILSSDNYHFYVVYNIQAPRKPRAKKSDPKPVEVVEEKPWVEPTLEDINKIEHSEPPVQKTEDPQKQVSIPKMVDLINQLK